MEKKVLANLEKCYSIAPLDYNGAKHILVAAEKTDRCILFDLDGNEEETIWEGPGGVMSMVQVPGSNGQFLATHKFYSPNDSKEAKIIIATPQNEGWKVDTLAELPFVHRFDILESGGKHYLIACTLKSGHDFKDDWSKPGKVYAAMLPEDLSGFSEKSPLELTVIKEEMLKNHGYYHMKDTDGEYSLICSENGVFCFYPPKTEADKWEIRKLLDLPASDATMIDLDGDGKLELITLSPFHGDRIRIYREKNGSYVLDYEYPEKVEFLHAIWSGTILGKPAVVLGHRKGNQALLKFVWEKGSYKAEQLDQNCGPANVYGFHREEKDVLIATNREKDEIAMYTFKKQGGTISC